MKTIQLDLFNHETLLQTAKSEHKTYLAYQSQYALGNYYRVTVPAAPVYVWVQLDAALAPTLIYMTQTTWDFQIPFNIQREWPYPTGAFMGKRHYARVWYATAKEAALRQNLAVNSHDQHEKTGAYPHASANAETRNEFVFYAKNAIDGIEANELHGSYPFQSWGIDARNDAEFTLEFGRPIDLEDLVLVLRADYPHDSHWTSMTIALPDEKTFVIHPQKTAAAQTFAINAKRVSWLKLVNLEKDKDASNFPALTQIEAWGHPSAIGEEEAL